MKAKTAHIVGMYKCGTSWLLHCLAAHPEIIAWREFDPYVAALKRDSPRNNPFKRITSLVHTLTGRLDLAHGNHRFFPRSHSEAFTEFFLGMGWIPLFGHEGRSKAKALLPHSFEDIPGVADALFEILEQNFRPERLQKYEPAKFHYTLGNVNFKRSEMIELMQCIYQCDNPRDMPVVFYDYVSSLSTPDTLVAFKAADQIMSLGLLREDLPSTKVVAVVRDGRDAMVSAWKYEALMHHSEAPWGAKFKAQKNLIEFMYTWGVRASAILQAETDGRLLMIRYEDLHHNFETTIRKVYDYLEVDSRAEAIAEVKAITDFEKVSGGRKKGEEADSVVRKGIVGDWKNELTQHQADLAWRVARRQLIALGYSQN